MVGLGEDPLSHIRPVPCISGIRQIVLPKAALWLDGGSLVQALSGPPPQRGDLQKNGPQQTHSQIVPWRAVKQPWNRPRISDPDDPWMESHCETHATGNRP
ncbi:hypothetical protein BO78DRAFT_197012 [Aspergillus sclerotiicarbonarius CBS 121057]|uniref:Uncharacterized protein n=1 Tax=Aspergillus sclerotiicarbonarius (strain CBS 121057 / IBT 28362) TaxID=1448318 RepID=A0A319DZX8_ASPSB|nr:hypothetical protein BO78DRAFT_197012 [Aspergillus sclerotiicarbonarius CBS 121057]